MKHITSITATNFKSLVDFTIPLAKFTCLIGLNGAGKSTVLQFVDFLYRLVHGDLDTWLKERSWEAADLTSKLSNANYIEFCVTFSDNGTQGQWCGTFDPSKLVCVTENLDLPTHTVDVNGDKVTITEKDSGKPDVVEIAFDYQGSVLSGLKEERLPSPVVEFKSLFEGIRSLELLAPEYLRQRTRESDGSLGLNGQNLSAFLHELPKAKQTQLEKSLKKVYPQFESLETKSLQSGWKSLSIHESYAGEAQKQGLFPGDLETEARHVNDGMLRLMAILAELQSDHEFILFDEIENGMNPELIEFVLDQLVNTEKQVLVTTHSPMILNYIEDALAKEGVVYLYKKSSGDTKAIKFFEIPSLAEKLKFMGPGEAFVDTQLTELADEIKTVTEGK